MTGRSFPWWQPVKTPPSANPYAVQTMTGGTARRRSFKPYAAVYMLGVVFGWISLWVSPL